MDENSVCFPHMNSLLLKREIHWRCFSVIMGHLVFYAILYSYSANEDEHSSAQSHDHSFCHFSALLWKHLPPSLRSTLQYCWLVWGFGLSSLFLRHSPGPLALVCIFCNKCICDVSSMIFLDITHHCISTRVLASLPNWLGHPSGIQHPSLHPEGAPLWADQSSKK